MSAFDIAGAIVFTPLAIFLATFLRSELKRGCPTGDGGVAALALLSIVPLLFGAVFCIARLCGAHA